MTQENGNPLGGRLTLGVVGGILLLIGTVPLFFAVRSPSGAGLMEYGVGVLFGLVGAALVVVAVGNPDALDIGTRIGPSEGEKYERRVEDPTEDG